jgi:hypothetical protein
MTPDIDGVLNQADGSRRDFLRKLIAGTVFTPPLLASFSLDGLSLTAAEALVPNQCFFVSNQTITGVCFDFSGTQYQDNFTDILLPAGINAGADVGGTGHPALNIEGHTGSGGSTWATVLTHGPIPIEIFFGLSLSADILTHRFDNSKGVGLLALAFALTGGKGLGLVVSNAGNTDKLQLMTVHTYGKVVPMKNVSLGAGIAEDAWYRLTMQIQLGFPETCWGRLHRSRHRPGVPAHRSRRPGQPARTAGGRRARLPARLPGHLDLDHSLRRRGHRREGGQRLRGLQRDEFLRQLQRRELAPPGLSRAPALAPGGSSSDRTRTRVGAHQQ